MRATEGRQFRRRRQCPESSLTMIMRSSNVTDKEEEKMFDSEHVSEILKQIKTCSRVNALLRFNHAITISGCLRVSRDVACQWYRRF